MTLPGLAGHLVSPSYLAAHASPSVDAETERLRARLAFAYRAARSQLGPASSVRAILEIAVMPVLTSFGFDRRGDIGSRGDALVANVGARDRGVAVLVTPWGHALDSCWRAAVIEARRHGADWCLLCNGTHLRVIDAGRLYSRRFAEFDLALTVDHAAAVGALRRIAGVHALGSNGSDPLSLHALIAASDRDGAGVCRSLRDGVLTASAEILRALAGVYRRPSTDAGALEDTFNQSLTIVYRIVFLLFAEARSLVPIWHPVYRESYSVESLREAAQASAHPRGLWDALRAIGRLAHAGCRADDLRVTPFNGRLFAPGRTPLAERRNLDDGAARRAVLALSTRAARDRSGRERIAYADLGVEQLGAVYETLLDYRPRLTRSSIALETGSGVRKATGTFYTPQAIADFIARRTLGPLVRGRGPDEILALRVVDPAMGSGACLVAACRFLASAYEQALVAAGDCHPGDVGEPERAAMRRRVAERCLYGVDLNPMAVQLARLSLWLATLSSDRPLSFLDHRLVSGDSLTGAWLSSLRHAPVRRRPDRAAALPLFADEAAAGALHDALPVRFSLESIPNDTVDQVRAKERALAALAARDAGLAQWKRIADLWCAIWFARTIPAEAFAALADAVASGSGALPARVARPHMNAAEAVAGRRRFCHWELEFPEVFFGADGRRLPRAGFDAVIGNPPWDMMRADSGDRGARDDARAELAAAIRFARDSGVYRTLSDGHANRYQLFVERALALTRSGGRIGLVLPWGLAADHGSAALRRHLLSESAIDALVGVDNHRAIFPIHRSVRFLLLTTTAGAPTEQIACRLGVDSTAALEALGDSEADAENFPVQVTTSTLERLSGSSLALPYLRSSLDLRICEKVAALHPRLGADAGWRARFGRELNATDDRDAFREPRRGLPVIDGKHLEPFRVAVAASARSIPAAEARRRLGPDRIDRPRLAYRDVAGATNRVTLIAALLPPRTVSTHTVFCLRTPLPVREHHALCALFNSFVVNYLVRLRVTTHVTTAIVEALPVPPPASAPAAHRELAAIGRTLSRRQDTDCLARVNALVARLYQLTRGEFEHVLETFPLVAEAERRAALAAFLQGA